MINENLDNSGVKEVCLAPFNQKGGILFVIHEMFFY